MHIEKRSEDEQATVIHWKVFAYAELDANDAFPGFPGDET